MTDNNIYSYHAEDEDTLTRKPAVVVEMKMPSRICVCPHTSNLYILSEFSRQISRVDPQKYPDRIDIIVDNNEENGALSSRSFSQISDMQLIRPGELILSDTWNRRLCIVNVAERAVTEIICPDIKKIGIFYPTAICLGPDGIIFAANFFNGNVLKIIPKKEEGEASGRCYSFHILKDENEMDLCLSMNNLVLADSRGSALLAVTSNAKIYITKIIPIV
jgi:hypothetical protein